MFTVLMLDIHESSVSFINRPNPPVHDWVMALDIIKIQYLSL